MNRREVLSGMALASAAVAVPAVALAEALPDRRAWDRAFAALQAAHKASDDFDAPFWRIEDAYQAAIMGLPPVTVEKNGRTISTAGPQLVDAADARDAQLAAIDKRLGRSAANDHYDRLSGAIGDAEEVLLNIPAPDGEALLWKVKRLYAEGEGVWEAGYEAQTHADLRRILSSKVGAQS